MLLMKIDLHTHTCYSGCAVQSPEDLVKAAKKRGLDAVAVTDHNTTKAWKRVIDAGKKHGIGVIPGEEIKIFHKGEGAGEVLGLFLKEEIRPGEFPVVMERIKEQGGLLVVAHPFDAFRNSFRMLEEYKRHYDAIEVLNSRVVLGAFNRMALEFAKKNGIAMTGGSDAHCTLEVGNAYTIADIDDVRGLASAIRRRKTEPAGRKSNPLVHSVSTFAKLRPRKS
jgi:hypothetical protein